MGPLSDLSNESDILRKLDFTSLIKEKLLKSKNMYYDCSAVALFLLLCPTAMFLVFVLLCFIRVMHSGSICVSVRKLGFCLSKTRCCVLCEPHTLPYDSMCTGTFQYRI